MTGVPQPIDTRGLPSIPWKNGSGTTRNLLVVPERSGFDDFLCRISIAEVRESGPFSRFPGVDRSIVLLEGNGMVLCGADGSAFSLTAPFVPHAFAGEASIDASLVDGPTSDFNVMVRRGRAKAVVETWTASGQLPRGAGEVVFYCSRGCYEVGAIQLTEGFMLRIPAPAVGTRLAPAMPDSILLAVSIELKT